LVRASPRARLDLKERKCQAAETLEQLVKKWRMVSRCSGVRQRGGGCIPVGQVCLDSQEVRPGKGLQVDYKEEDGQKVPQADGEEDGEYKRDVMERKSGRGLPMKGGNPASYTAADCFNSNRHEKRRPIYSPSTLFTSVVVTGNKFIAGVVVTGENCSPVSM
jgi:hypothetical protein